MTRLLLAAPAIAALALSALPLHAGAACLPGAAPAPGRLIAQSAPGAIELGREVRMVKLEPACAADGRETSLAERVAAAPPRRRFLLVIEDLRARAQPGVLFDLKLSTAHGERGAEALLGTLNFYAAQKPGVAARPRMVSYDVTDTLRALAAGRRLDHGLTLAIQPADEPAPGSGAAVGRITLVEQ